MFVFRVKNKRLSKEDLKKKKEMVQNVKDYNAGFTSVPFKGTVSVISSDPSYKDDNAGFTTVPFKGTVSVILSDPPYKDSNAGFTKVLFKGTVSVISSETPNKEMAMLD